jgi:hypothetical protein
MDRFHTEYGVLTEEGKEIANKFSMAVRPIIKEYANDIEALVFMREAAGWIQSDIAEHVLRYGFEKFKRDQGE